MKKKLTYIFTLSIKTGYPVYIWHAILIAKLFFFSPIINKLAKQMSLRFFFIFISLPIQYFMLQTVSASVTVILSSYNTVLYRGRRINTRRTDLIKRINYVANGFFVWRYKLEKITKSSKWMKTIISLR